MKTLKSICLIFVALMLFSCQGPKGEPGIPGNANVQSVTVETTSEDGGGRRQVFELHRNHSKKEG